MLSPTVNVPLLVNEFPNKLAPNFPNNIQRNPHFCSFASFLIVSLKLFINKPDSSRDLIIFMKSFISLLEIIMSYYQIQTRCIKIAASIADAAAVDPNGSKTLLANGLCTFPIKGNPVFSNDPKSLPKNPPNCPILCN